MMDDWNGPWPGDTPFVFPEALRLVTLKEAEAFRHDGCPYCTAALKAARQNPKERVLVNAKTRDILGVFLTRPRARTRNVRKALGGP